MPGGVSGGGRAMTTATDGEGRVFSHSGLVYEGELHGGKPHGARAGTRRHARAAGPAAAPGRGERCRQVGAEERFGTDAVGAGSERSDQGDGLPGGRPALAPPLCILPTRP